MKSDWSDMPEEMLDRIREVRESLKHSEKGKLLQTKENCVTVLENDPLLKGAIRMNLFTETMAIVKDLGWKRTSPPINDDDMCQLYLYMEMFYGLTVEKNIQNAVRVVANRNEFHPVREYLEGLHWDGRERIRYALKRYLGAADDDLTYTVFKTFMIGAISRVYNPGIKFEMMLCLVGSQGVGKSSFFRLLAIKDDWFCDDIKKLNDDEIYLKLQGHWFIEMAEMLGTSSAKSVEEIKAFISRQKEIYRIRFDRYSKDRYRQCVFTGTTNRQRFLPLDRTGNRRFYPIPTDAEKAEVHILHDEAASRAYMDQLWAEAMEIFRSGDYSLVIPPEYEREMDIRRLEFMVEDTATGTLQDWLDRTRRSHVCTKMIYRECFDGKGEPDPMSKSEINSMMNNTIRGWVKGPQHRFELYGQQRSWVPIPEDKTVNKLPGRDVSKPPDVNGQVRNEKPYQMDLDDLQPCPPGENPFDVN